MLKTLVVGLLALGAAGCGNGADETAKNVATVSGNCALHPDTFQLSPLTAGLPVKELTRPL